MKPATAPSLFGLFLRAAVVCVLLKTTCAHSADFQAGFDSGSAAWTVHYDENQVRLLAHRRNRFILVAGAGSENLELKTQSEGQFVQMEHPLPMARVFDELKASLWVRSNRPGAVLFLRVIFPHQIDPSTGKVLRTYIRGETYSEAGTWQKLTCTTLESQIEAQLRRIRGRFRESDIDAREASVDRVYLTTRLLPGTTEFFLDELRLSPVVPAREASDIQQAVDEEDVRSPVEFRLDRLAVNGIPFFPRILPYQRERPEHLRNTRANVVWIPNLQDEELSDALRRQGLWLTATPPRALSTDGQPLDPRDAGILPFTERTEPILFWNLGLQISPEARRDFVARKRQVLDADARYRRPIMADVAGLERVYARHVDMLGVSRPVIGTSFGLQDYRDWLIQRRQMKLEGASGDFLWTWLQVESRFLHHVPPTGGTVIEPEQIRLQAYAALAAGVRGLGYLTTQSLDADDPLAVERRLAITQLNLELELLEPWLATGTLVGQVPFQVTRPVMQIDQRMLDFRGSQRGRAHRDALLKERENQARRDRHLNSELEAAVIRSDFGTLLLPIWYHSDAQFVPPQMAANDATIIVRGVPESAAAWEITTSGERFLPSQHVTGGTKITLPKFDQTAAVIITSDHSLIEKVREKIGRIAQFSARTAIDLQRAKFERVRKVNAELESLGAGQVDAHRLLAQATEKLANAEKAYGRRDYELVRELTSQAGQLLRILQSAHWYDATRGLASPVSSPYAVSFQTLPDHWRLIERIGRSRMKYDANLLPSADFESIEAMLADGWQHSQNDMEGIRAAAELYPTSRSGAYVLRLAAAAEIGTDPPKVVQHAPVTVTTAPLPVHAGQIVHVSGRARVVTPVTGSLDGAMLYDSQTGPDGAIRWRQETGWRRFEMIRAVRQADDFRLTMSLTGLGEIQFDDIQVVPHTPRVKLAAGQSRPRRQEPGFGARALELLDRIPRFRNPISGLPNSLPQVAPALPGWSPKLPAWSSPWSGTEARDSTPDSRTGSGTPIDPSGQRMAPTGGLEGDQ